MNYSKYFSKSHASFVNAGVYDGIIGKDSLLHVHPLFLKDCQEPEFVDGYSRFLKYFTNIILLCENVKEEKETDLYFRRLIKLFTFKEIHNTGLGYSTTKGGSGISGSTACLLAHSACEIVRAGIKDASFFVLLPLFEEGIGADRISDMTIFILRDAFQAYTTRKATELGVPMCRFRTSSGKILMMPTYKNRPLYFIPACLLTDLPVDKMQGEIWSITSYNQSLREIICKEIGITLSDFQQYKKDQRKACLLHNTVATKSILDKLSKCRMAAYDFAKDPKMQYIEAELSEMFPNGICHGNLIGKKEDVLVVANQICEEFKHMIEDNHMWKLLYDRNQRPRSEKYFQQLFYLFAYSFCRANDIDINRESDLGCGCLDFKLSKGFINKVIIEIKLSSNQKIAEGFKKQLPQYLQADVAQEGILLLFKIDEKHANKIGIIQKAHQRLRANGKVKTTMIVIDAVPKPTASKL